MKIVAETPMPEKGAQQVENKMAPVSFDGPGEQDASFSMIVSLRYSLALWTWLEALVSCNLL